MKKALITGITGQMGSYLADLLVSKDIEVHGIVRRCSTFNTSRIDHLYVDPRETDCRMFLHHGDLTDSGSLRKILYKVKPDYVFNCGCQSHVAVSFDNPEYTVETVAMGTLRLLDAMRDCVPESKFVQCSSSEMFGSSPPPQSEETPFHPRSPYACGKVFGFHQTVNYREAYGMFAANAIMFNYESEKRGPTFVTRKISRAATRIKAGLQDVLYLGNLDARRDWGFCGDYADALWRIVQHDKPDDFVVATGESHSVRDFLDEAFGCLGMDWRDNVRIDERHNRPSEVNHLCGDFGKMREATGWTPTVGFKQLVRMMVDADMKIANRERLIKESERA